MQDQQDETNTIETTESIQAEINRLQQKLVKVEQQEDGETLEPIEMPTATVTIKLDRNGSCVTKKHVTPAELMLLVAEHHKRAGGSPVIKLELGEKIQRDPRVERARLLSTYDSRKVQALFPGALPSLPKNFRQAMNAGIEAHIPSTRLLEMNLVDKE